MTYLFHRLLDRSFKQSTGINAIPVIIVRGEVIFDNMSCYTCKCNIALTPGWTKRITKGVILDVSATNTCLNIPS
jgi:hypothetical protein